MHFANIAFAPRSAYQYKYKYNQHTHRKKVHALQLCVECCVWTRLFGLYRTVQKFAKSDGSNKWYAIFQGQQEKVWSRFVPKKHAQNNNKNSSKKKKNETKITHGCYHPHRLVILNLEFNKFTFVCDLYSHWMESPLSRKIHKNLFKKRLDSMF